ncbi:hypothetical protein [Celeribacter ethanolicus]|uniref:hypothetical protein n=1 Tax=Celeribacter ethanolicus TaxID=1758178 RepID=UPI0012FE4E50|nr:hypothetical protein [Celeribacter ethanolicus]
MFYVAAVLSGLCAVSAMANGLVFLKLGIRNNFLAFICASLMAIGFGLWAGSF